MGPCGLAEFLDDPPGFVPVPALGSGWAEGTHGRGEPRNRGSFGGQALHYPTLTLAQPQLPAPRLLPPKSSPGSSQQWAVGVGVSCPAQITPNSVSTEGHGSPQRFIPTVLGAAVVPEQPRLLGLYIGIVLALLVRSGFPALETGGLHGDCLGSTCLMEHFGN